jgi:uncharacterized protein (TIGR03086 family)
VSELVSEPMRLNATGLLERAIGYALVSMNGVVPALLSRPTPCAGWDLGDLVGHLNDGVCVLREGIDTRRIARHAPPDPGDPVATFRFRAHELLGAWLASGIDDDPIAIGTQPLPAVVVAGTGAVEIVVHAWDVAVACGMRRPIPPALATELLGICPLIASGAMRSALFAPPVPVPSNAIPSDRLVAFLGRDPR